jgi:hypothetical protein
MPDQCLHLSETSILPLGYRKLILALMFQRAFLDSLMLLMDKAMLDR